MVIYNLGTTAKPFIVRTVADLHNTAQYRDREVMPLPFDEAVSYFISFAKKALAFF